MSNALTPFNFNGAELRVLMIEGSPWFAGVDAATLLGYARANDAINQHVEQRYRRTTVNHRGGADLILINEPGLYSLIFGSKLEGARAFRDWVFEEVLPAIRRDGGYIRAGATPDQLDAIIRRAEAQTRMLQAAQGLVDPKWLEAKARHVIARGLGEEPEIDPADRPLTTGEYLEGKGITGAALRSTSPAFGKAVKKEYRARHNAEPPTVERFVDGALRPVAGYTEADRPIFDVVWARTRAVVS